MSTLDRLQAWYLAQCDDTWELTHGVKVETIDSPGWVVAIDLVGTRWAGRSFEPVHETASEHDWWRCWVDAGVFHAAAGPCTLDAALGVFLDWVGAEDEPAPRGEAVDEWLRQRWREGLGISLGDDDGNEDTT